MSSRYNLRSRSQIQNSTRYEDETWIPGANNGYTAGRTIDMGTDINALGQDTIDHIVDLQNNDLYEISDGEDVEESQDSEEEEEEYSGSETEDDDEDAYSLYSEDEETEEEEEPEGEEEEPETDQEEQSCCWGCVQDQPNQMAHMEWGGCLYDESIEVDNSDEEKGPESPQVNLQFNDFPIQGAAALAAGYTTPPPVEAPTSPPPILPKPTLTRQVAAEPRPMSILEMTNDDLLNESWNPSFSKWLSSLTSFGTISMTGPNSLPISNPPFWFANNNHPFTLVRVRDDVNVLDELKGVIMLWDGSTFYQDGKIKLCLELFYQDIHPFIYDAWDYDDAPLTSCEFSADELEWVMFEDDDVMTCVENAGLWTPKQPFHRNRLGYGEWENERLDVQYTGCPPRVQGSHWQDDVDHDEWVYQSDDEESVPDSIS